MLYLEYERLKIKYLEIQRAYDAILTEKEAIFQKTQPKAINSKQEKVKSSPKSGQFDAYLIEKEKKRIDERLSEAKGILDERVSLMRQKEEELRKSKDIDDIVYVSRYIERIKVRKISKLIDYSEPQTYRILKSIREKIEHDRK